MITLQYVHFGTLLHKHRIEINARQLCIMINNQGVIVVKNNIPATRYTILHASSLQKVMQNIEIPLYLTLALPPPNFFFLLFKKNFAVENNAGYYV